MPQSRFERPTNGALIQAITYTAASAAVLLRTAEALPAPPSGPRYWCTVYNRVCPWFACTPATCLEAPGLAGGRREEAP